MVNMNEKIQNIKNEIGKVIKGKEEVIDTVLAAMLAEGHILLEDVPGVSKTTLALTLSAYWDWATGASSLRRIPYHQTLPALRCTTRKAEASAMRKARHSVISF